MPTDTTNAGEPPMPATTAASIVTRLQADPNLSPAFAAALYPDTQAAVQREAAACVLRIRDAQQAAARSGADRLKLIGIANVEMMRTVREADLGSNSAVAAEELHGQILRALRS